MDTDKQPKRRRWPWIVAGILLLVIVVAAVALPALLKPERFRGRIEAALEAATGWDATLGDLDFSVARGMVLTVQPASLTAPGDTSRIAIETLAIRADLWPLLEGKLVIRSIDAIRPEIRLVRLDEESGWVLPLPEPSPEAAAGDTGGGLDVTIDEVSIRHGTLTVDDRVPPGLALQLREVELTADVQALKVAGGVTLGDDGGRIRWSGPLEEAITLELEDVRTEILHAWLGPDLVRGGGLLSGSVVVDWPGSIRGDLAGRKVTLLAGEQPFESCEVDFEIVPDGDGLRLASLEFRGAGATLTGSGPLSPDVDLDLRVPQTSLATTLAASRSVLPLPLDVEPPGTFEAAIDVTLPAGGDLTYTARGSMSAAVFRPGDPLPAAKDVRASFALNRHGVLEVKILEGALGGGQIRGTAWVDPVYPPGKLRFDGGLQNAILGQLLDGFVSNAAREISGPTALQGKLALDLSGELSARSLAGQIEFDASQVSLPGWDIEAEIVGKLQEKLGKLTEIAALVDPKLTERLANQATARAKNAEAPMATELFESINARVDFDSWPWRLENLSLGAGGVSAIGKGSFDPTAGAVDLTFTARLGREVTNKLVERHPEVRKLVGPSGEFALPLRIQGPMLKPSVGVSLEGLALEAIGKQSLEQAAKDAATDAAKDALKDTLRGLLDKQRDKRRPSPTATPAATAPAPAATPPEPTPPLPTPTAPGPTPEPTPTPEGSPSGAGVP